MKDRDKESINNKNEKKIKAQSFKKYKAANDSINEKKVAYEKLFKPYVEYLRAIEVVKREKEAIDIEKFNLQISINKGLSEGEVLVKKDNIVEKEKVLAGKVKKLEEQFTKNREKFENLIELEPTLNQINLEAANFSDWYRMAEKAKGEIKEAKSIKIVTQPSLLIDRINMLNQHSDLYETYKVKMEISLKKIDSLCQEFEKNIHEKFGISEGKPVLPLKGTEQLKQKDLDRDSSYQKGATIEKQSGGKDKEAKWPSKKLRMTYGLTKENREKKKINLPEETSEKIILPKRSFK